MRKYDVENFVIEPLVLLDEDFTDEASLSAGEMKMIRLLRINCELYNLTDGGDGLVNPSIETRRKMSIAAQGKKMSDEARHKMSTAHRGQTPWSLGKTSSEETRQRIRAALMGNQNAKGQKQSAETRLQMSESKRGQN